MTGTSAAKAKYAVKRTRKFNRGRARQASRPSQRRILGELDAVVRLLAAGEALPERYRDHMLLRSARYKDARTCHIRPDWVLVYRLAGGALELLDTGTHSDLAWREK